MMNTLSFFKPVLFFILFTVSSSFAVCQTQQPQWKFPIAFEDATGARDTIFFVWDTTAVNAHDTVFGEYPINLIPNAFQVYLFLDFPATNDTSKFFAIPPNYPFGQSIYAKNYVYPIKISWDTALFNSPFLPSPVNCAEKGNDYLFFSGGVCHKFNMLLTDTLNAPAFN